MRRRSRSTSATRTTRRRSRSTSSRRGSSTRSRRQRSHSGTPTRAERDRSRGRSGNSHYRSRSRSRSLRRGETTWLLSQLSQLLDTRETPSGTVRPLEESSQASDECSDEEDQPLGASLPQSLVDTVNDIVRFHLGFDEVAQKTSNSKLIRTNKKSVFSLSLPARFNAYRTVRGNKQIGYFCQMETCWQGKRGQCCSYRRGPCPLF